MTTYKGMQIGCSYLSGYNWGPVDDGHCIGSDCKTIEEAKEEIDRYLIDKMPVTLTLTVEELLTIQLALSVYSKGNSYSWLKKTSDKINQAMEDIQKDIDFEKQYNAK
jgi:hypothetical protein